MYDFYKNFTFLSKNLFSFNEIIDLKKIFVYHFKKFKSVKKIRFKKIT